MNTVKREYNTSKAGWIVTSEQHRCAKKNGFRHTLVNEQLLKIGDINLF